LIYFFFPNLSTRKLCLFLWVNCLSTA